MWTCLADVDACVAPESFNARNRQELSPKAQPRPLSFVNAVAALHVALAGFLSSLQFSGPASSAVLLHRTQLFTTAEPT